jgi:hypothetical protein
MANTIRIKRRPVGGAIEAPSQLASAELAFNEQTEILYYGKGDGGTGNATSVITIGGSGAFVNLSGTQTITGNKTFSGTVALGSSATANTPATGSSDTTVATTAFVKSLNYLSSAVTSVGISLPTTVFSNGTAVTGTGNLSASFVNQNANTLFAGPTSGGAATPAFRTLVENDIPSLSPSKITNFDTQVRTSRLDQMAAPTASVAFNNQRITGLTDPSSAQDAATKAYVDGKAQGLDVKESVRAATTGNITLSGAQTIDGVSVIAGDRVLVKNQDTASQNGIYVAAASTWSRAADADSNAEVTAGMFTFVEEGTTNGDTGWVLTTNNAISLNTTSLAFAQFSGAGTITAGDGLTQSGNTINVASTGNGSLTISADSINLTSGIVSASTYRSVTVDTYGRVTAGTNPTTLSGYGITDAQPLDATLTALAGVTTSANKLIYASGSDTFLTTDLTAAGRNLLDDTDSSAMRTTLGLAIGTDVQAYNAALASIAGLSTVADRMIYTTASNTYATATLTSFARNLLDDADNTTARNTLGLGSIATQASNSVSITGGSITNLTTFDNNTIDGGTF